MEKTQGRKIKTHHAGKAELLLLFLLSILPCLSLFALSSPPLMDTEPHATLREALGVNQVTFFERKHA